MPAAAPSPGRSRATAGRGAQDGGVHGGGDRGAADMRAADGETLAAIDPADLETGAPVMNEASQLESGTLPLQLARRVNAVCNQFERAWKAGQRPGIEEYLGDTPEPARSALLRELIALEIACRRRVGETPR